MRTALYQLGEDFLSTIIFLIVHFVTGEIDLAIAVAIAVPENVRVGSGYAWAALMVALGRINLYVASRYSIDVWALLISVYAVGAKVVAFLI